MAQVVVVDGPDTGRSFSIEDRARIGTEPSNEIALTDRRAAPEHSIIQLMSERFEITGLDSETQGKMARHFLIQKRRDYSLKPNERIELKRYSIPIPLNKASPFNKKEHTHSWRLDPEKP